VARLDVNEIAAGARPRVLPSTSPGTIRRRKTIMKNIAIVALLATIASVGALVACGGGTPAPAVPDTTAPSGMPEAPSAVPSGSPAPKAP
jgi:hypothetical protein